MFACHTEFLCFTSFLVCCQGQLPEERNRLSIPVEHQDVILIHDRVIPTAYCLLQHMCQMPANEQVRIFLLRVDAAWLYQTSHAVSLNNVTCV